MIEFLVDKIDMTEIELLTVPASIILKKVR